MKKINKKNNHIYGFDAAAEAELQKGTNEQNQQDT